MGKTLGEKIKEVRKNNKLTQREFGEKIGAAYVTVSCWERGTQVPGYNRLKEISRIFEIDLADLVESTVAEEHDILENADYIDSLPRVPDVEELVKDFLSIDEESADIVRRTIEQFKEKCLVSGTLKNVDNYFVDIRRVEDEPDVPEEFR